MNPISPNSGFHALGVAPGIVTLLAAQNISDPTPVQLAAIPIASDGRDLIAVAQTGTGKTLAFGLPMAEMLTEGKTGLVLAPTRELAQQIAETLHKLRLSCVLVVGGAGMHKQVQQLRMRPQVIVATPGRLMDHMAQRTVSLSRVSIVVLDEADRMLDMGFAPAIKRILDATPRDRQTMLFSATMPDAIAELADQYLRMPKRVEIARPGTMTALVDQELVVVSQEEKGEVLHRLIRECPGTVLVFARTRHGARKLAKAVRAEGASAAELHADRTLAQRREALSGFKTGDYRVLVATDIAARGIDVKEISLVVNYDVPEKPEDYVHRIGRTGRAGSRGRAVTIAVPAQAKDVRDIERLLGIKIPISRLGQRPTEFQKDKPKFAPAAQVHRPKPGAPRTNHGGPFQGQNPKFKARRRFGAKPVR